MGADLTIEPIFTSNYAKYEPTFRQWVDVRDRLLVRGDTDGADRAQKQVATYLEKMYERGFFRDGYNSTSLLKAFGLSWKDDVDRVLTNNRGKMRRRKARRFLRMLADREPDFEWNLRNLKVGRGRSRTDVERSYHRQYARLKSFLQEAIDRRLAITCSL